MSDRVINDLFIDNQPAKLYAPNIIAGLEDTDEITQLQNGIAAEATRAEGEEARIEALFTAPTQEAVDTWLSEHPEATTTVQDGAITLAKLHPDVRADVEEIDELKSGLTDTVIKSIPLTMSNGKINSQGAVGGGDAGGYYKVSQAIDVSMASKIRIYNYYYGPTLSTVTILGKTGAVIDYLLNPASGNEYVDFTIPYNGEVAYVQGTSSNTPTVVIYTSSDSIDRRISVMEKEFSSYLIDDGANWRE